VTESVERVYICRCEEVGVGAARQAIEEGAQTVDDVKRRTRAGMGACQGIYCTRAIADLINQQTGIPLEQITPMTTRMPARLLTVGSLAMLAVPEPAEP
jgi:NAD(P)H-nitrite reductase large subunit